MFGLPGFREQKGIAAYLQLRSPPSKPMAGFDRRSGAATVVGCFDAVRLTWCSKRRPTTKRSRRRRGRIEISIRAGDRSAFGAGDGSALAIACTADADATEVIPGSGGGRGAPRLG